jgi:tRNA uridine 5-carboxymethylaminomethyl modification enzyme
MVRFGEKESHQIFVEPEGFDIPEVYLQGVSTSLPLDVQEAIVHSIPAWRRPISCGLATPWNTTLSFRPS